MTAVLVETPQQEAERRAEVVRGLTDLKLPALEHWNLTPCKHHEVATPLCEYRQCGGDLWAHQRVGISWLYTRKVGLVADNTGSGKTNLCLGLIALLKQRGELGGRALIVCQTPAVQQWLREAHRWVPALHSTAVLSGMVRQDRIARYVQPWEILIIGYHMALRDINILEKLAPDVLIVDDVDPLLTHSSQTHLALNRLARTATRRVVMNATAIQMRLQQLHAALTLTDGHDKFGSLRAFERQYVKQEPVTLWHGRSGRKTTSMKTIGYRNVSELREKVAPMILRRKADQLTDVKMPTVMPPTDIWLELHPEQRKRYDTLQAGVLKLLAEEGASIKKVAALQKFLYGQQICSGLPALRLYETRNGEKAHVGWEADGPQASTKLDWVMSQVTGEWQDEKLVVFVKNIGLVAALEARLHAVGMRPALVQGGQTATQRTAEIDRFWSDSTCRVLIGTSAIERSLNLQCSRRMIFVDLLLNPGRMIQLLGRIKRGGSKFSQVYTYTLLTEETQEGGYLDVLQTRQALADHVFDDSNDLFEALDPILLLELIGAPKKGLKV